MPQIDPPGPDGRKAMQRLINNDAAGHIKELSATPASGVQSGKLVVARIDSAREKVLLDQVAVSANEDGTGDCGCL